MSLQRITITIPEHLYYYLTQQLPPRKISQFTVKALEEKILNQPTINDNPIDNFFNFAQKLPQINQNKILKAIRKGRQLQ